MSKPIGEQLGNGMTFAMCQGMKVVFKDDEGNFHYLTVTDLRPLNELSPDDVREFVMDFCGLLQERVNSLEG